MARRNVKVVELIAVKKPPAFSKTGWQFRRPTAEATSKILLDYRACIRSALEKKKFQDYRAVREAFKVAAKKCAEEMRRKYPEHYAKKLVKAIPEY